MSLCAAVLTHGPCNLCESWQLTSDAVSRLPLTILALSGLTTTLVTSLYVGDVMTEHVDIKEAEAAARLGGKVPS